MKTMSRNKKQSQAKSASLTLTRSPVSSHSRVLFFLLFPAIFANSYPAVPPSYKSIPYWFPFFSLPPLPVFLASAGTLSPTSLSLSLWLSRFLPQTTLSIFPSFFACPPSYVHSLDTLFLYPQPEAPALRYGFLKKVSEHKSSSADKKKKKCRRVEEKCF